MSITEPYSNIDNNNVTETSSTRLVTLKQMLAIGGATVILSIGAAYGTASIMDTEGPRGAQGAQGIAGTDGERGPRGYRGKRGRSGRNGMNGASGTNGAPGATVVRDRPCSDDIDVPLPYC